MLNLSQHLVSNKNQCLPCLRLISLAQREWVSWLWNPTREATQSPNLFGSDDVFSIGMFLPSTSLNQNTIKTTFLLETELEL